MVRAVRRHRTATRKRRGSGLPTVLMVSALLLVAAFTIVGLGYNHLSVSNRLNGAVEAKCLAEAAVAKGIEELQVNKEFGKSTYAGPNSVNIICTFPSSPTGANGVLTFNQANADLWKIRCSTNNFDGASSAVGSEGVMVPKDAVHLIGVGRCNGVTRTVEAVLYLPKYPYAISSSGPVQTDGGLYVASVDSEADISNPAMHAKGHLVSNSNAGADAIKLNGSGNKITGDLQSASGATLGTSLVQGEMRLNAAAAEIPDLNISSYDTAGKPGLRTLTSDTGPITTSASPINGFVRFDGGGTRTLTFDQLHLDKGVMYVDGNLQVNQGIYGKGAIIVKGTTTIRGGGSFTSDNGVALLSGQKIDIAGETSNPSTFKGLMYTEGGISSKDMKLRGVLVNNDLSGSAATNATNTEIIELEDKSKMEFSVQTSPGSDPTPGGGQPDGTWNFVMDPSTGQPNAAHNGVPWGTGPEQVFGGVMGISGPIDVPFYTGFNTSIPADTFKSGGDYMIGYIDSSDGLKHRKTGGGNSEVNSSALLLGWEHMQVKVGSTVYPGSPTSAWIAALKTEYKAKLVAKKGGPLSAAQDSFADSVVNNFANDMISSNLFGSVSGYLSDQMEVANQAWKAGGPTPSFTATAGTPGTPATYQPWKLNLSDFINRSERVRILYWRET